MKLKTPLIATLTTLTLLAGTALYADNMEMTPEAEMAAMEATGMTLDEATALVIAETGGSNARAEFDSEKNMFEVEVTMPDGSDGEYLVNPSDKSVTAETETDDDQNGNQNSDETESDGAEATEGAAATN